MKVYMSKYPKHRFYHNWLYNMFGYTNEQTVKVRIDDFDTWSMDQSLAHIITPMLHQLARTKQGSAMVDMEDVPFELQHEGWDHEEGIHDRWDWVMQEMIFAFESKFSDWESTFSSGDLKFDETKLEDGTVQWTKSELCTYNVDRKGRDAYQARVSNGFRLFGKYFEGLWD